LSAGSGFQGFQGARPRYARPKRQDGMIPHDLWRLGLFVFGAGLIVCPIITDLLRAVVHRRRERADGLGGTQDIALWGTMAGGLCLLGFLICLGFYLATR